MNPLVSFIREHSQPLDPIPTGEAPRLQPIAGIRAVVFDLYGTLLVSSAGGLRSKDETARDAAVKQAIESAGLDLDSADTGLAKVLDAAIERAMDQRREHGIDYPEVEIREVWAAVIAELESKGFLELSGPVDRQVIEQIVVAYECATNPVWPMPELTETMAALHDRGLRLGIVSNAQFYTPLIFPALIDRDLTDLGFDEELQVYSFQERESKPSPRPYEKLARRLERTGINTGEVLYVGNDRLKDIWPAGEIGFRTALFAGDARSLRWAENDSRLAGVSSDLVITRLGQLLECLV